MKLRVQFSDTHGTIRRMMNTWKTPHIPPFSYFSKRGTITKTFGQVAPQPPSFGPLAHNSTVLASMLARQ